MNPNYKTKILKITFIRSIENANSKKVKQSFSKLKSLFIPSLNPKPATELNVSNSFKRVLSNVHLTKTPPIHRLALELLNVTLTRASKLKQEAFEALKTITKNNTKKDISRIMRLLSKKFLTNVDDKFLNEQIKILILKNKIHNPSILELVKNTDIDIEGKDFSDQDKIHKTEKLVQIFLAIELFYPVEFYFLKMKEVHNRQFFRLLRIRAEQKLKSLKISKIETFVKNFNHVFFKDKEFFFSNLKSYSQKGRKIRAFEFLVTKINSTNQIRKKEYFGNLKKFSALKKIMDIFEHKNHVLISSEFEEIKNLYFQNNSPKKLNSFKIPIKNNEQVSSNNNPEISEKNFDNNSNKLTNSENLKEKNKSIQISVNSNTEKLGNEEFLKKIIQTHENQLKITVLKKLFQNLKKFHFSKQILKPEISIQNISQKTQIFKNKNLDKKKLKRFLKFLQNIFIKNHLKNYALAFERLINQEIHFEVLEIEDLTNTLEPISVHIPLKSEPAVETHENASVSLKSAPIDASSNRLSQSNISQMAFIRKSDFMDRDTQIYRYGRIYKPKVFELNQQHEIRKGENQDSVLRSSFSGLSGKYRRMSDHAKINGESAKQSLFANKEPDGQTFQQEKTKRSKYKN